MRSCLLALSILLTVADARAEPTRELYVEGREEIFQGDPVSTQISARARIRVGLDRAVVLDEVPAPVTRAVLGGDGWIYLGTAGKGLWRYEPGSDAPASVHDKGVITALAPVDGGVLFATDASGQVHRVERGKAQPYVKLDARYVWDLAASGRRQYAVTGVPGQLVELKKGRADVRFTSEEKHLRSIAIAQDALILGGGDRGIVYRWTSKGARALYDSAFSETTGLIWRESDASVVAAFTDAKTKAPLPKFGWIGAVDEEKESDDSPFEGSELVRIDREGRVEVLWRGKREGVMALRAVGDDLIFSTGGAAKRRGRVYRVRPGDADRLALLARVEHPLATSFVRAKSGALFVGTAGAKGRLVRLGPKAAASGEYLSVEQDFQRVGRVGRLWFDADIPAGAAVGLSLRTGNTSEVDATWSAWSEVVRSSAGGAVSAPEGRYAQFRLELKPNPSGAGPEVRSMHASVVRLNDPPVLHEVFALRREVRLEPLPGERDTNKTLTVNSGVLNKLRQPRDADEEGRLRVRQTLSPGARTIAWHASDTNGDQLLFRVEVKSVGASTWREVASHLDVPFWSFDSRSFPDGRYLVRVTASDRPSNQPRDALKTSRTSAPLDIDNTPPRVAELKARLVANGGVGVSARVEDDSTPLAEAHVSVDGGPWFMFPAADGLIDARQERLQVELRAEELGRLRDDGDRRRVSVRVRDDAGNEATKSVALPVR